jgi:CRISPR/Cas system-associated exonuclease Cas4 (RecB family)
MQEMMRTNQESIETKMDAIQEKKDVNLREIVVEMKDGRKERTASQEPTEANLDKMEQTDRSIAILEKM